ncbi:MAG: S41 family peptidase [Phycisphaerales bacterium]
MPRPSRARRAGTALALAVCTTGVIALASAEAPDDQVRTWASQVWTTARTGDDADFERLLAAVPAEVGEADAARAAAAARMSDGLRQLQAHRAAAADARDQARDDAIAEMRTEVAAGNRSKALRHAVIAQSHSADFDAILANAEIMSLVRWGEAQVIEEERQRHWIDAQELLYLLRTFYEDTDRRDDFRRHDDELKVVNARVELLSRYTPKILHEMREARAERLGEPPIGPFNESQVIDYRERLQNVDRRMLSSLLTTAAQEHIEGEGWRPLLDGGLESLSTFATTVPLRTEFPRLGEASAVSRWNARIREWQAKLGELQSNVLSRRVFNGVIDDIMDLNRATLRLPDEVIVREFGDGAMGRLDTYSDIIWPDELRRFRQQTEGDFVGVGILIRHNDKREIEIVQPLEGTPAYKAGVQPGDVILNVGSDSTVGWSLNDAVDRITGPQGSTVKLGLQRGENEDPVDVVIRRSTIKIHSVKGWEKTGIEADGEPIWNWMIDEEAGIAYVRLTQFTTTSFTDLLDAWGEIKDAQGKAPNGLILDLRHNPGGLLTAAVQIGNLWINRGDIVTGENREGRQQWRQGAMAGDARVREAGTSTVVLINKGSASASEIVAGALQAHGVAVVVGERSFGKGSVQTVHPVTREGSIKLTTQYYRLPSPDGGRTPGRLVHKRDGSPVWGVDPDVEVPMTVGQASDAIVLRQRAESRFLNPIEPAEGDEEVASADINDLLNDGIDPQLQTALLLLQSQALTRINDREATRRAAADASPRGE